MQNETLLISVDDEGCNGNFDMLSHIIAGLRFFISNYPEALFKLDYNLCARIVNYESGMYSTPAHPNERVYNADITRSISTSDRIIEHLSTLEVGDRRGAKWWYKPKEDHARILATKGLHPDRILGRMLLLGSIETGTFEVKYNLQEVEDLNLYYTRAFDVRTPSALPHVSKKPEPVREEKFVAARDTNEYYNVTINWDNNATNNIG